MPYSDTQDACILYMSDIHGEYNAFKYLLADWRDDIHWMHLVGDIYDRGPASEKILDYLETYPHFDIEWGNHDIVWMGASLGQAACICHVVRNCARYGNMDILTDVYGMDLQPLIDFALHTYVDDPCQAFGLKEDPGLSPEDLEATIKIQKAMAILQFKVEAALIDTYPEFGLQDRKLLHLIDYDMRTVNVGGVAYELTDTHFPTVDKDHPYQLTSEEKSVMNYLVQAFINSKALARHIQLIYKHGSLYKICHGDLLLHACVPLNEDGSLKEANIFGNVCKGKALYDEAQAWIHRAFESNNETERMRGRDLIWFLWLGPASPLFAKSKMATFEIYLCKEKEARKEVKNSFYTLLSETSPYDGIFKDFGLDPKSARIICGHVPVKVKDGESPIKAGGRIICIDGGMSAAYQKTTGLMGFALTRVADELTLYSLVSYDETQGIYVVEDERILPRD